MISPQAVKRLVLLQSILNGLQVIAAASVLGDVIGAKYAALFIVVVAGATTAVNSYMAKSVGDAVMRIESVVGHAEDVTQQAKDVATQMAQVAGTALAQTTTTEAKEYRRGRPPI